MIALILSEAYCYDMLSIAYIKALRTREGRSTGGTHEWVEYFRLSTMITLQVDATKHRDIAASSEYKTLLRVNEEMYDRINLMKTRPATGEDAMYIDDRVHQRFLAKKALQARWFPETPLTEIKHGYENAIKTILNGYLVMQT